MCLSACAWESPCAVMCGLGCGSSVKGVVGFAIGVVGIQCIPLWNSLYFLSLCGRHQLATSSFGTLLVCYIKKLKKFKFKKKESRVRGCDRNITYLFYSFWKQRNWSTAYPSHFFHNSSWPVRTGTYAVNHRIRNTQTKRNNTCSWGVQQVVVVFMCTT